jgi:hypothetical protein
MVKLWLLRMASAAGIVTLAFLFVGAVPFIGSGAGLTGPTPPAVSVNRTLKGDRLPLAPDWQGDFGAQRSSQPGVAPRAQIPFGCDPAFSPIFSAAGKNVYRRCMA